ncbi:MAG: dockerin type I repeat-containing protein [candidate division Zixibacteria bacterium]|nr:dockerin type I repeat-containing protein [candidate division Zixibacteria bacterium]
MVAGWTSSFGVGTENILLSKLYPGGRHRWTRTLGGSSNDVSYDVIETYDGGFVLTGDTKSFGAGNWDFLLAKFNTDGDYLWARTVGGGDSDGGREVIELPEYPQPGYLPGLVVTGFTESFGAGNRDVLLAKFEHDGFTCVEGPVDPTITSPNPTIVPFIPTISEISNPIITHPNLVETNVWHPEQHIVCDVEMCFVAYFMTPEGEPYPFDRIRIGGEDSVLIFDSLAFIETEAPESTTYEFKYRWNEDGLLYRTAFKTPAEESREFEFYALSPEELSDSARIRPYLLFQEENANASLLWDWVPDSLILHYTLSCSTGKYVGVAGGIDDNISNPPNFAVEEVYIEGEGLWQNEVIVTLVSQFPPGLDSILEPSICIFGYPSAKSDASVSILFAEIDPEYATLVAEDWKMESIERTRNNSEKILKDLDGNEYPSDYLIPQYAVPPGNYILSLESQTPEEFISLEFPIEMRTGRSTIFDAFHPRTTELGFLTFSFFIAAENPFAHSSYSNLFHAPGDSISVDVTTEHEYDWWGCFVLPTNLTVDTLFAYSDTLDEEKLTELFDFTTNHIEGSDLFLVVVRNEPYYNRLKLEYTLRGDVNGNGEVELGDIVFLINYLFKGDVAPHPLDRGDVNCNGEVDIGDVVYLINYLYKNGPPPCQG